MTLAQCLYFGAIMLFGFVLFAARHIPDGTFILASIIPVFLAATIGVVVWVYAWTELGAAVGAGALVVAWLMATALGRLVSTRLLFVLIYIALSGGLVCVRLAMQAGVAPA